MPIYATPLELAVYITGDPDATIEQAPANAAQLLRSASLLIREATKQAIYKTDDADLPTEARYLNAMRDATCAMAQTYSTLGINPTVGASGIAAGVQAKALGSASVSYATATERDAAKSALADGLTLTQEAYLTLKQAGLLSNAVVSDYSPLGAWVGPPWDVS